MKDPQSSADSVGKILASDHSLSRPHLNIPRASPDSFFSGFFWHSVTIYIMRYYNYQFIYSSFPIGCDYSRAMCPSLFSPCHCLMSRIDEPVSSGFMGRVWAVEMARIHQQTGLQRAKLCFPALRVSKWTTSLSPGTWRVCKGWVPLEVMARTLLCLPHKLLFLLWLVLG